MLRVQSKADNNKLPAVIARFFNNSPTKNPTGLSILENLTRSRLALLAADVNRIIFKMHGVAMV